MDIPRDVLEKLKCCKCGVYLSRGPVYEVCAHRQWVCPVLGAAHCDWLGPRAQLLQHCQDQHPDLVLDNPCHLEHDITTSSDRTFLVQAFQLLFLLHTKVCVATAKMYHSVRHLGSSDDAENFTYNLEIRRNGEPISKKGQVAPQGCLAIQEDTSLALDINSLVSVLIGASFTVEEKFPTWDCVFKVSVDITKVDT